MDCRDGRCAEGDDGGKGDTAMVNRVMLRFRPIAPKPVARPESAVAVGSEVDRQRNLVTSKVRSKRKYGKTRRNYQRKSIKKRIEPQLGRRKGSEKTVVPETCSEMLKEKRNIAVQEKRRVRETLTPSSNFHGNRDRSTFLDSKNHSSSCSQELLITGSGTGSREVVSSVVENSTYIFGDNKFKNSSLFYLMGSSTNLLASPDLQLHQRVIGKMTASENCSNSPSGPDNPPASDRPAVALPSRVIIETVLKSTPGDDVRINPLELGSTDVQRMMTLGGDVLPGFVSDSWNRVRWVNRAFEEMVLERYGSGDTEGSLMLSAPELAVKEELPQLCRAFTCRVRVHLHGRPGGRGEERYCDPLVMIPCDVWRMDSGGFAWRLDVKAALSLGRY